MRMWTSQSTSSTRVLVLALVPTRVLVHVYARRQGPIIAPPAKRRQDRDNGQLVCLRDFLMNVGEFVKQREAVKNH